MKKLLYLFSFLICWQAQVASAQDLIILKEGEQSIKCNILSITDSLIVYQLWKSSDTTRFKVNPQDLLSFQVGKKSKAEDHFSDNGDPDSGLLEMYLMGKQAAGYIITQSGDTIEGFLDIMDVIANQFKADFTDNAGNRKKYLPGEIREYGYNNIRYYTVKSGYQKPLHPGYQSKNGQLFLHRILDGNTLLYRVFKIEFNKGTLSAMKYPPMYMGKLDHEFLIINPKGQQTYSFGRTARATLNVAFGEYRGFIKLLDEEKSIQKKMIPEWTSRFADWYSENKTE